MTEAELIDAQLMPDMLPLGYQVKSCAVHSIGGIEGARAGSFSPDMSAWPTDLAGLRSVVRHAGTELSALDRDDVDALTEADTHFVFGDTKMPFTGANFLLSFSQPNFYFHATTAYAILRAQGMQLGKRDFIGLPRIKRGTEPLRMRWLANDEKDLQTQSRSFGAARTRLGSGRSLM